MGMTPQFPLTYKQVEDAIAKYKSDLENGVIDRADFWDFCGRLGVSDDEVIEVVKNPCDKNIKLSLLLKKYITWQKGQYLSGKGWGGPNSSKAIFRELLLCAWPLLGTSLLAANSCPSILIVFNIIYNIYNL